jgi:tRNA threonylcarbamoyladenosine biosynthesis protein TsaE
MAAEPAPRRFLSRSVEATERLGEDLGRALVPGAVVALEGELGSGKTALVRGLARGLGAEDEARSPTFTLMQEHAGRIPFFHFDAWMAGREALFLEGGGAEYLTGEGIAAVEWAERVEPFLPRPRIVARLGHRGPAEREITVLVLPADAGAARSRRALEAALRRAVERLRSGGDLVEIVAVGGSRIP